VISLGALQVMLQAKDNMSPALATAAKTAAVASAAVVAAVAAIAVALVAATKEVLAFADSLDNQSRATQVGVEALQVYAAAAERAGQGPAAITTAIQRMQRAIGEGTAETDRAIENLNLSIGQLKALRPQEQFELIMQRLGEIPDPAEKAANAMILLGRSGGNLLALSGDALPQLNARMRELGIVIDQETVVAVDKLEEDIDLLGRTAEAAWRRLGIGVASSEQLRTAVLNVTDIMGGFNQSMGAGETALTSWVDNGIAFAVKTLSVLAIALSETKALFADFVGGVFDALGALAEFAGKIPGFDILTDVPDPEKFRIMAEGQKDLAASTRETADNFVALLNVTRELEPPVASLGGAVASLGGSGLPVLTAATKEAASATLVLASASAHLSTGLSDAEAASLRASLAQSQHNIDLEQAAQKAKELGIVAPSAIQPITLETLEAGAAMGELESAIGVGQQAMNLFGIESDSAFGKLIGWLDQGISMFNSVLGLLGKLTGGLGGLFGGGGGGFSLGSLFGGGGDSKGGGIGGLLGGLTSPLGIAGLIGGGVLGIGKLIGSLFGKSANIAETVERDFGAQISEGLQNALNNLSPDLSTAATLGLGGIINEAITSGSANFDLLTERAADTFSFLERGQITSAQAQEALNASVSALLPHLDQLGAAGVSQLERLLGASKHFGVEFEGLSQIAEFLGQSLGPDLAAQAAVGTQSVSQLTRELGKIRELAGGVRLDVGSAGGGALPSFAAAGGADFIARRPMLGLVGESGPERVKVTPLGSGGGGGGNTFNITIPVTIPESAQIITDGEMAERIAGAVGVVVKENLGDAVGNMADALSGTFQGSQ